MGDGASTGSASVDTVVFFALNFLLLTAVVERLMAVARGNSQRSFKRTSPSLLNKRSFPYILLENAGDICQQ